MAARFLQGSAVVSIHHVGCDGVYDPIDRLQLWCGQPGERGGERGDLLVEVAVSGHPTFQRQDTDIFSNAPLSFATAALGGDVKISTVDGDVMYTVAPGTQTGTRVRLRGKGVPSLRNKDIRGDHYVTLVVQVPIKLTNEQVALLLAGKGVRLRHPP